MTKFFNIISETSFHDYLYAGTAICATLTLLRLFARLYTNHLRHRRLLSLFADDYLALSALFFLLGVSVQFKFVAPTLYEYSRILNSSRDRTPQDVEQLQRHGGQIGFKLTISAMTCVWICLWSVKFSFLLLIRRLLGVLHSNWWLIATIYTSFMFMCTIVLSAASCIPISRVWDLSRNLDTGSCANSYLIYMSHSTTALFDGSSDLAIMFLGLQSLKSLRMPLSQRLGVQAMFCLSSAVVVVAIVKATLLTSLRETIDAPVWLFWTWTEVVTAVAILNIPPLKGLVERMWEEAVVRLSGHGKEERHRRRSARVVDKFGVKIERPSPLAMPMKLQHVYKPPIRHSNIELAEEVQPTPSPFRLAAVITR